MVANLVLNDFVTLTLRQNICEWYLKRIFLLFGYLVIGDICMCAFSQSAWISHDCEVHTL